MINEIVAGTGCVTACLKQMGKASAVTSCICMFFKLVGWTRQRLGAKAPDFQIYFNLWVCPSM